MAEQLGRENEQCMKAAGEREQKHERLTDGCLATCRWRLCAAQQGAACLALASMQQRFHSMKPGWLPHLRYTGIRAIVPQDLTSEPSLVSRAHFFVTRAHLPLSGREWERPRVQATSALPEWTQAKQCTVCINWPGDKTESHVFLLSCPTQRLGQSPKTTGVHAKRSICTVPSAGHPHVACSAIRLMRRATGSYPSFPRTAQVPCIFCAQQATRSPRPCTHSQATSVQHVLSFRQRGLRSARHHCRCACLEATSSRWHCGTRRVSR